MTVRSTILILMFSLLSSYPAFAQSLTEEERQCQIIDGSELRTAPGMNVGQVMGNVCVGDNIQFLGWGRTEGKIIWYKVRVISSSCAEHPAVADMEGWIHSSRSSMPANFTPFLGDFDGEQQLAMIYPSGIPDTTISDLSQPFYPDILMFMVIKRPYPVSTNVSSSESTSHLSCVDTPSLSDCGEVPVAIPTLQPAIQIPHPSTTMIDRQDEQGAPVLTPINPVQPNATILPRSTVIVLAQLTEEEGVNRSVKSFVKPSNNQREFSRSKQPAPQPQGFTPLPAQQPTAEPGVVQMAMLPPIEPPMESSPVTIHQPEAKSPMVVIDEYVTSGSRVMSPPRATAQQAAAYILKTGTSYAPEEVYMITWFYWDVCTQVGIDPLLAISQSLFETGNFNSWWSQAPRRNLAGLMVTGEVRTYEPTAEQSYTWSWDARNGKWWRGLSFASWNESVRQHVGRLLAYAMRDEELNDVQRALVQEVLGDKPLPDSYRGSSAILSGLNGRWAVPGYGYADKIAAVANSIRNIQIQ